VIPFGNEARLLNNRVQRSLCALSVDSSLILLNMHILINYCVIVRPVLVTGDSTGRTGLSTRPTRKPNVVSKYSIKYLNETTT
jgi:hypothetical protein